MTSEFKLYWFTRALSILRLIDSLKVGGLELQSLSRRYGVELTMIAAIFDLDNTIILGESVERRFFYRLLRERRIGFREISRMIGFLVRNLYRFSPLILHTNKLYLAEKSVSVMERLATQCVTEEVLPRISHEALAHLARHRAAGHLLVIITGCPDFLFSPLSPHLKADIVLCGRLERQAGRFTGHTESPYPYGIGKRQLLERLVKSHDIDLAQSFAYADRPSDLALLSAVRHPAVVNAGRRLARIAKRRGWELLRW
jgi:HAD superfamily hydrolase (TIGR01490 family)